MNHNCKIFKKTIAAFLIFVFCFTSNVCASISNVSVDSAAVMYPKQLDDGRDISSLTVENIPCALDASLKNDLDENGVEQIGIDYEDAAEMSSLTTLNSDGTKTLHMFSEPIKYFDNSCNAIKFIDNSLIDSTTSEYALENKANDLKIFFPENVQKGIALVKNKYKLTMIPYNNGISSNYSLLESKENVSNEMVEYCDVFGKGTDLQYITTSTGVKENIVLESYTGQNEFIYVFDAPGLVPKLNITDDEVAAESTDMGQTLSFIDEYSGDIVWNLDNLWAKDSYVNQDGFDAGRITYDCFYRVEKIEEYKYLVTVVVNKDFIDKATYPVVIDPTTSVPISSTTILDGYYNDSGTRDTTSAQMLTGNGHIIYEKLTQEGINQLCHINPSQINSAHYIARYRSDSTCYVPTHCYASTQNLDMDTATYNDVKNARSTSLIPTFNDLPYSPSWQLSTNFDIHGLLAAWIQYELDSTNGFSHDNGFIIDQVTTSNNTIRIYGADLGLPQYTYISVNYNDYVETINENTIYDRTAYKNHRRNFSFTPTSVGTYVIRTIGQATDGDYVGDPSMFLTRSGTTVSNDDCAQITSGYVSQTLNCLMEIVVNSSTVNVPITIGIQDTCLNYTKYKLVVSKKRYATINNYYDNGWVSWTDQEYGSGTAVSKIEGYQDHADQLYWEYFGLYITHTQAPQLFTNYTYTNGCTCNNIYNAFISAGHAGSCTTTNVIWSGYETIDGMSSDHAYGINTPPFVCVMTSIGDPSDLRNSYMHEVLHNLAAYDHYCKKDLYNDNDYPCDLIHCHECGEDPYIDPHCVMRNCNNDRICNDCFYDVLNHLNSGSGH